MIKYRSGFKYQLAEDYEIKTELVGYTIDTEFIKLTPIGMLVIRSGYAWDGASGPTIDTQDSMRGSLVHDALYQLMRQELLPQEERDYADRLLAEICIQDGMSKFRANSWLFAVNEFAASAARPENKKEILTAP